MIEREGMKPVLARARAVGIDVKRARRLGRAMNTTVRYTLDDGLKEYVWTGPPLDAPARVSELLDEILAPPPNQT